MDRLTIELPRPTREFIDRQIAGGGYTTAAEYIVALVDAERARLDGVPWTTGTLRRAIQEGADDLDRGHYTAHDANSVHDLLEDIKAQGRKQLTERQGQGQQFM